MSDYDFVAIGDIVTDAFIRLKDAELHCDVRHENCQICFRFGDKVPYESVTVVPAVGNSPNASVAAARLGLNSALVTNLGADQNGREAITTLKNNSVRTEFVRVHPTRKTNYHYVLWYLDDRTILIKHEEYPYEMPNIGEPKWVYLSSLGENSFPFHDVIADYFETWPEIKVAFQPGTYQIKLGKDKLARIYKNSEIFFCNTEEARRILEDRQSEIKGLLQKINGLGPKIVVITDGKAGAYAFDARPAEGGGKFWFMPPYPDPNPPLDRTGAGDSFAATFTSALALGKSVPEALAWAPINSMSVVQKIGAQAGLLTRPELEEHLKNAPENYQPREI